MDEAKEAAYVMAMAVGGLGEILAMLTANQQAIQEDKPLPYTEEDFKKVVEDRGLYHNAIMGNLCPQY